MMSVQFLAHPPTQSHSQKPRLKFSSSNSAVPSEGFLTTAARKMVQVPGWVRKAETTVPMDQEPRYRMFQELSLQLAKIDIGLRNTSHWKDSLFLFFRQKLAAVRVRRLEAKQESYKKELGLEFQRMAQSQKSLLTNAWMLETDKNKTTILADTESTTRQHFNRGLSFLVHSQNLEKAWLKPLTPKEARLMIPKAVALAEHLGFKYNG